MSAPERLSPDLLLAGYSAGFFPMADMRPAKRGAIGWYCPDPRAILPLEEGALHIPRSLAKTIRRGTFQLTLDTCFERIMRECAAPRPGQPRESHWISEEMIEAYTALHTRGRAHSLEAWLPSGITPQLVGGIYGVSIGGAFFAESMFCRPELGGTDASKVCLVALVQALRSAGYQLLDVQLSNPHTAKFGIVEIPHRTFQRRLAAALGHQPGPLCPPSPTEGDSSSQAR